MIESESRIYIAADKTSNYYKVGKEKYQELLDKHITKDYKKSNKKQICPNICFEVTCLFHMNIEYTDWL